MKPTALHLEPSLFGVWLGGGVTVTAIFIELHGHRSERSMTSPGWYCAVFALHLEPKWTSFSVRFGPHFKTMEHVLDAFLTPRWTNQILGPSHSNSYAWTARRRLPLSKRLSKNKVRSSGPQLDATGKEQEVTWRSFLSETIQKMGLWLYPWVESTKFTLSCRCVVRCQMGFEFSSWLKSHTTRARVLRQIAVQWQPIKESQSDPNGARFLTAMGILLPL